MATSSTLQGTVVLITGGANGIGAATARAFATAGARVCVGDIDHDALARAETETGAQLALPLDVTSRDSFRSAIDRVEDEIGQLNCLVNNAGIMTMSPVLDVEESLARRIVDVNLHGVMNGTHLALERMAPRGQGHIFNVASVLGESYSHGLAHYCATKYGVIGYTDAVRMEYRDSGIDFTLVLPGSTDTELTSGADTRGLRKATPQEVADAIVAAARAPRRRVYVPKLFGMVARTNAFLPQRAFEAVALRIAGDATLHPDSEGRRDYEERIREQ